jgi:hypothetical protein
MKFQEMDREKLNILIPSRVQFWGESVISKILVTMVE